MTTKEKTILSLPIKFEKAVRFLAEYMPVSEVDSRKPVLFHDIRVAVYLYEHGYPADVVLAGLLHDALEWSAVSEELLRIEFGDTVTRLVLASTKDNSIIDKEQRAAELIERCVANGQEALIVKSADIIDSFKWYTSQENKDELRNHCLKNTDAIFKYKPDEFDDKIFVELADWHNKYFHLR